MTTREFLNIVVNANISDETTAKANELITALDKRNAQRKGKPTKANAESAERRKAVADFLASRPTEVFNREQIAEELGLTLGQVTSAASSLAKGDAIVRSEVKVGKTKKTVYQFKA